VKVPEQTPKLDSEFRWSGFRVPVQAKFEVPVLSVTTVLTYLNDNANRVRTISFMTSP